MSSPRAPPPRSGKRNQRGRGGAARGGAGAANSNNAASKANHPQDGISQASETAAAASSSSSSVSPQLDQTESSSMKEVPTKPSRASKNAERKAARSSANQDQVNQTNNGSTASTKEKPIENDSISPSNSKDTLNSSSNSNANAFHSSPPSPQPDPQDPSASQDSPQTEPASTAIGALGGWLSNRIMGGNQITTKTEQEVQDREDEEEEDEDRQAGQRQVKMHRSDSVSMTSEAESSAAYSASEVDGFEDAEDGDQEESVVGEQVEIGKEQEKEASREIINPDSVSVSAHDDQQADLTESKDGKASAQETAEEDLKDETVKRGQQESDDSKVEAPSTQSSPPSNLPSTPPAVEPSEPAATETVQSTPPSAQRQSASVTSASSSTPSVSASTSNSPSANSTSIDESVKSGPDPVNSDAIKSDALRTPMQPRTLLHQATPTKSEEEDLPTRLSEDGSIRGVAMLQNDPKPPPSKPSSLASVDIKERLSLEENEREEKVDRNSVQSFNLSHRNSDASSQRSTSQSGGMLSPSLNNSGQISPGGSGTSPGGTKRSFWGLLRSPSGSPATPGPSISSGRGGGIQRAFSLSSEGGGGSGSEKDGSSNGLLSPVTPTATGSGSTGRGISPITTSAPSTRSNRAPSFSPMSSFSSFAASISAAKAAALGSSEASIPKSESKPKVRLARRQVDEMKIAEDAMRFIDARDILHTETDAAKIRELATRLEEGWREKLHEVSALRSQVEEVSDLQDDLQDENDALRTQLGSLSNTIVSREEDFETFQKSVVEQQARERLLWDEEAKEERENVMHLVKEAATREIKEKAINAQLRLILVNALQGRVDGLRGLRKGISGLTASSSHSPLESRTEFENPDQSLEIDDQERQNRRASAARLLTASQDSKYASPRRNSRRQTTGGGGGGGGGDGGEDDDLLFAMSMSPTESRPATALFNEPLSFQSLRELGLIPQERDVQELQEEGGGEGEGKGKGEEHGENPFHSRDRRSIPISELPMSQLVAEKHAADNSLVMAIQEENKSLRALAEQRANKNARLEEELEQLRARLAQTEAAISEMFNDVSIANRE